MSDTEETLLLEDSELNEEDRRDILEQIDQIVDENKIPISTDLFTIKPNKRGFGLPVSVNILALAVIVGGFFFATYLSQQRRQSLSVAAQSYMTAEGRLIAEIRRESEARIEQKNAEIDKIRGELETLDAEREQIAANIEDEVARRERPGLDERLAVVERPVRAPRVLDPVVALPEENAGV